jgi:endonuclease/exonuclease/phosphatase family metal-dependent hydrolase
MRVLTWNLWWRFGPWEDRADAITEVLRAQAADVVFLQELWSVGRDDQVVELADDLGYCAARTEGPRLDGVGFCNGVLSRWPIEPFAEVALPDGDGAPGHRRALAVVLLTPWGRWPVVCAHLHHRFDGSAVRERQVVTLLRLVDRMRREVETTLPVLVGADCNAVPDSDEIRLATGRRAAPVADLVLSDVWEQVGDGPGHTWSRGNPYVEQSAWPNRRLDYLFVAWPRAKPVGNPVRAWLAGDHPVAGFHPSDHYAVVADLVAP